MFKISILLGAALISVALTAAAEAQHKQALHHKRRNGHITIICNERGCVNQTDGSNQSRQVVDANGNGAVVGRRPAGCPHEFCGCEASRYLFGEILPDLNLASNWIRKFARALPAPGMVAARNHHVMVLMNYISGHDWLVHDGNSGGGLTRDHVVSISGYTIVDPHIVPTTMRLN